VDCLAEQDRLLKPSGIDVERKAILRAMQVIRLSLLLFLFSIFVAAQSSTPVNAPWQMQDSGTTASLRGIDSVDGTVAWASGTGGTVLKTIDGGAHWTKCAVPDAATDGATLDFRGVQAWDATTAVVMASGPGDKSRLYETEDGCKTWRLILKNPDAPYGFFDSLSLMREQRTIRSDEGFGLLLGDSVRGELSIFETRDGGSSWTRIHDPLLRIEGKAFAASNGGISRINATNDFVVNINEGSEELRLNYNGRYWLNDGSVLERTWNKVSIPLPAGAESAGAFGVNSHVLIKYGKSTSEVVGLQLFEVAVGGDYTKPNETAGTAVWSADNGGHWTASTIPPHGYRSSVQWIQGLKLWITVGTNGSDVSRDDGKTWQPIDDGNWNALSLPFVVGPNGRIARMNLGAFADKK
jgi:photosystem II stability/assembly factor-like uncharacterized protein